MRKLKDEVSTGPIARSALSIGLFVVLYGLLQCGNAYF